MRNDDTREYVLPDDWRRHAWAQIQREQDCAVAAVVRIFDEVRSIAQNPVEIEYKVMLAQECEQLLSRWSNGEPVDNVHRELHASSVIIAELARQAYMKAKT